MSKLVIFKEDETKQLQLRERTDNSKYYCMGWTPSVNMSKHVPKTELATFENENELCDYALQGLENRKDQS